VGTVAAISASLVNPAQARSGTWLSDVWYVHWSASSTYTRVEPHMFTTAYAAISRYTGSGPTYYYGPGVQNSAISHKTSYVYASNGYFIGNYFRHQGTNFRI
jgi:hypothetical protein